MSQAPRFPVCDLANVHLLVPDLDKAVKFYTSVWGLIEASHLDGVVYLRGSGSDPYLVALHAGDRAAVVSVGLRADPSADLAALRQRTVEAGAKAGPIAPVSAFGGGVGFAFLDRGSRRFTIVQGDERPEPMDAPLTPRRLAHVNINTADVEAELAFYQDGLGCVITDRTNIMSFLRANDDHHIIVLATDTIDTLNHIAFLQDDLESVMKASGRMVDAGYPVAWGPGRHGPGDNVFNYFIDPFGFVIEHTAEILKVDDSYKVGGPADWVWPPGRTDHWGVGHVKGDACKKAQKAIPFS
jgi:catechol 2,3-dioxygenase-like lactoylglutathione lyase family enzyme